MKAISFKKFALIFSASVIATYSIVAACADGWFSYEAESNFTPEVFVDKSYSPLFFAPSETFYGNGFDTNYNSRFNTDIVKDWSLHIGKGMTEKEVSYLLLNDSASSLIPKLLEAARKKTSPPSPMQGLNLSDSKVRGFVEFLNIAKIIEKSSVTLLDPWDYDQTSSKVVVPLQTIVAAEKLYIESKDSFLKNRFWFQTVKANFYSASPKNVITFFDKTKAAQPKNDLYYRALSYVAGVHYRQKDFAKANYLYSIVFDEFAPLRQVAAYNFRPREDADFNASLAVATTSKQKAALWAMLGYYSDEHTAIREIYSLDPANPHLDYLLTRMINKYEVFVNGMPFTTSVDYKNLMRNNLVKEQLQLIEKIAGAGKTANPHLWLISAGYMNVFAGKYSQATHYFDKAQAEMGSNEEATRQIRLLRLINTICSVDKMDDAAEKKLLPELQWVQKHCESSGDVFRCGHVYNWSNQYISGLYATAGNTLMAELFYHRDEYYHTLGNLEAMKVFLQSANHTEMQKFLKKRYPFSLADIFTYQSVMSAFAGDLDAAIGYLKQAGHDGAGLPGNPFNGKIKDCHDCDHAATQKINYSSMSMLVKMKEMETNIASGNDIYNNSLLLANAYYNITYHGNARAFYENAEVMNQSGNDLDPFYHPQLLGSALARKYYEKAFNAASTPEQKAKCVYMMAKCERNDYYSQTVYAGVEGFDDKFVSWKSFKTLHEEYSNTRYYQEVLKECGYFKSYIDQ